MPEDPVMKSPITLTLDGRQHTAEAPLGVTLASFFSLAGHVLPEGALFTDGSRLLSPALELVHRFLGAELSSTPPAAMLAETEALVAGDLLVMAGIDKG